MLLFRQLLLFLAFMLLFCSKFVYHATCEIRQIKYKTWNWATVNNTNSDQFATEKKRIAVSRFSAVTFFFVRCSVYFFPIYFFLRVFFARWISVNTGADIRIHSRITFCPISFHWFEKKQKQKKKNYQTFGNNVYLLWNEKHICCSCSGFFIFFLFRLFRQWIYLLCFR